MALPRTLSFASLMVFLGDGATPENFDNVAAFTDKSVKFKLSTGSTEVPDADDPDLPMSEELEGKMLSLEVSGSGVLAMSDLALWRTWAMTGQPKNIRVMFNDTGANGGGYVQCPALLTDFSPGAKKGEKCSMSVTIASSAAFSWVPNA
jgi:hypothetical protein